MNECSVNIKIQQQVNESWELNNCLTVFIQGDACDLVGDIQVRLITHDENEKIQSKFTSYSVLKLSTLYWKKITDIENQSFASGSRTVADKSLKSFQNISSKMPYHAIFLNSGVESNRNTKEVINIVKKALWM